MSVFCDQSKDAKFCTFFFSLWVQRRISGRDLLNVETAFLTFPQVSQMMTKVMKANLYTLNANICKQMANYKP